MPEVIRPLSDAFISKATPWHQSCFGPLLLMVHKSGDRQLICKISHSWQGFIHPRWLFGISSTVPARHPALTPPNKHIFRTFKGGTIHVWYICLHEWLILRVHVRNVQYMDGMFFFGGNPWYSDTCLLWFDPHILKTRRIPRQTLGQCPSDVGKIWKVWAVLAEGVTWNMSENGINWAQP